MPQITQQLTMTSRLRSQLDKSCAMLRQSKKIRVECMKHQLKPVLEQLREVYNDKHGDEIIEICSEWIESIVVSDRVHYAYFDEVDFDDHDGPEEELYNRFVLITLLLTDSGMKALYDETRKPYKQSKKIFVRIYERGECTDDQTMVSLTDSNPYTLGLWGYHETAEIDEAEIKYKIELEKDPNTPSINQFLKHHEHISFRRCLVAKLFNHRKFEQYIKVFRIVDNRGEL